MEPFGDRLAELRRQRGLTQQDLADLVGATGPMIRGYERGVAYPRVELLVRIADTLECSLDDLFGREPPKVANRELQRLVERISTFPNSEQKIAVAVLEGLVLRHQPPPKPGRKRQSKT